MKKTKYAFWFMIIFTMIAYAASRFDDLIVTNSANFSGPATFNGAVTNSANTVLNGGLSGTSAATLITNVVGAGGITVTGQGTKIITVTGSTGASALTNAPNLFTSASQNTFTSWTTFNGAVTNNSTTTLNGNTFAYNPITFMTNGIPTFSFATVVPFYAATNGVNLFMMLDSLSGVNNTGYGLAQSQIAGRTTRFRLTSSGNSILDMGVNIPFWSVMWDNSGYDSLNLNSNGVFQLCGTTPTMIVSPQNGITTYSSVFQAVFTNEVNTGVVYLGDVYGPTNTPTFIGRRARGTISSPSAIQQDDVMAAFNARGFGTTIFSANSKASMVARAAQNWTDTSQGTYITFSTTPTNTTTITEGMRLDQSGFLGIGTTTPSTRLHVVGQSTFKGGMYLNFVTTGTNYTSSVSDNIVSVSGTTATSVTNFLPAINGSTITNGFCLEVIDGQASAATTNIVIFPNGSDTISGLASRTMNANRQTVSLVVDGPNKKWLPR